MLAACSFMPVNCQLVSLTASSIVEAPSKPKEQQQRRHLWFSPSEIFHQIFLQSSYTWLLCLHVGIIIPKLLIDNLKRRRSFYTKIVAWRTVDVRDSVCLHSLEKQICSMCFSVFELRRDLFDRVVVFIRCNVSLEGTSHRRCCPSTVCLLNGNDRRESRHQNSFSKRHFDNLDNHENHVAFRLVFIFFPSPLFLV